MKNIVIGTGEVGKAIMAVLECEGVDKTDMAKPYDVIHICFPYFEGFIDEVKRYQDLFTSEYTVIHSTVPIGTSELCNAIHSPVRGVHPNLEEGIMTFVKYFGGDDAEICAKLFEDKGIAIKCVPACRDTEALKLLDTMQYGLMIMIEKEIFKYCKENALDFDFVYRQANRDYNMGYRSLGMPQVVRPYLNHKDGPIGGHCVIPNAKIIDFWLARTLLDVNDQY